MFVVEWNSLGVWDDVYVRSMALIAAAKLSLFRGIGAPPIHVRWSCPKAKNPLTVYSLFYQILQHKPAFLAATNGLFWSAARHMKRMLSSSLVHSYPKEEYARTRSPQKTKVHMGANRSDRREDIDHRLHSIVEIIKHGHPGQSPTCIIIRYIVLWVPRRSPHTVPSTHQLRVDFVPEAFVISLLLQAFTTALINRRIIWNFRWSAQGTGADNSLFGGYQRTEQPGIAICQLQWSSVRRFRVPATERTPQSHQNAYKNKRLQRRQRVDWFQNWGHLICCQLPATIDTLKTHALMIKVYSFSSFINTDDS